MSKKETAIIDKLRNGTRLYKYTGKLPPSVLFENSEEKIH
jgi:hypothetical protein